MLAIRRSVLVAVLVLIAGCVKSDDPTAAQLPPGSTDLNLFGIAGAIDLPDGCRITMDRLSQVTIDRDDDGFTLRIAPRDPLEITLVNRKQALKGEPFEMIGETADGYAAWVHDKKTDRIEVYREVTLGGRPFVASCQIAGGRATKALAELVWRSAQSLRSR